VIVPSERVCSRDGGTGAQDIEPPRSLHVSEHVVVGQAVSQECLGSDDRSGVVIHSVSIGTIEPTGESRTAESKPFDVRPRSIRVGGSVLRGYNREDFTDPFNRYLPPPAEDCVAV